MNEATGGVCFSDKYTCHARVRGNDACLIEEFEEGGDADGDILLLFSGCTSLLGQDMT